MSFGSGSIPGYLQRLRNSKIRKANRQKEFKGGNDYSNVKSVKTEYDFPKIKGYNLTEMKKKIQKEANQEKKKQLVFWIIGAILILVIILVFNFISF